MNGILWAYAHGIPLAASIAASRIPKEAEESSKIIGPGVTTDIQEGQCERIEWGSAISKLGPVGFG
jgi:hypothetical protein